MIICQAKKQELPINTLHIEISHARFKRLLIPERLKRLSKFKFGNTSKPNTANKRREEELKLDLGGFQMVACQYSTSLLVRSQEKQGANRFGNLHGAQTSIYLFIYIIVENGSYSYQAHHPHVEPARFALTDLLINLVFFFL